MNNNITSKPDSFKILMNRWVTYSSIICIIYFILNFQSQFGFPLEIESNNVRASIISGKIEIFHLLLHIYKGKLYHFHQKHDFFIKTIISIFCQYITRVAQEFYMIIIACHKETIIVKSATMKMNDVAITLPSTAILIITMEKSTMYKSLHFVGCCFVMMNVNSRKE